MLNANPDSHIDYGIIGHWIQDVLRRQLGVDFIVHLVIGRTMSRREQLESMLVDEPQDTFLRYALAMELKNDEEFENSAAMFRELMQDDPPYVPAFFMLGQQLVGQDKIEEAKTILQSGIEQAHQQGDLHAAGEMTELLTALN